MPERFLSKKQVQWILGAGNRLANFVPIVLVCATFVAGGSLLFSGVWPTGFHRLELLARTVPLPVLEMSHLLGSVVGVLLLFLAHGLYRRLDAAYHLTISLLGLGIGLALLKGFEYEVAIVLLAVLIGFLPCRDQFYRRTRLVSQRFSLGWTTAVLMVLGCMVWLGLVGHRHVEYRNELWWKAAFTGEASRFLRTTIGMAGVTICMLISRLFRPPGQRYVSSEAAEDLRYIKSIVSISLRASAGLALVGDKRFLLNEEKNAFIMYGVQGRSWIGLGDPVGPEVMWNSLLKQFYQLSDRHDGWSAFYGVGAESLYRYVDLGLTCLKIGEEARVSLTKFQLDTHPEKDLRSARRKLEKEGCRFEVIPVQQVSSHLPSLKQISDAWLAHKQVAEKRFSLGYFYEPYLRQCPVAVIWRSDQIVAFTNILSGARHEECTADLMRYHPDGAPSGVMDILFAELLCWAKDQGYHWFNLGLVPLAGTTDHRFTSIWARFETFMFRYGEHFYNFQGLRQYKQKFRPEWASRYLIAPGGIVLPRALVDLTILVAGGMKGVVLK